MSEAQQPPPPGWQPGYGPPPGYGVPEHPQATTVLVFGILGLVMCGLLGPVAWVMGNKVLAEIDASGGMVGGRGNVQAGRITGIVGTVLLVGTLLFFGVILAIGIGGFFAAIETANSS